jgi:hypothetical protein
MTLRSIEELREAITCPACNRRRTSTSSLYLRCLSCDSRLYRRLNARERVLAVDKLLYIGRTRDQFIQDQLQIVFVRHQPVLEFLSEPRTAAEVSTFLGRSSGTHTLLGRLVAWGKVTKFAPFADIRVSRWQAVDAAEASNEPV